MQFAFVPGRGTTDAIFIIRQLQEKFLSRKDLNDKNLTLFFAFVDLEKAFDRVPRKVLWWAMRKVGVEEWIVRLVQAMYNNARSRVRVGSEYSEEFEVGVGVHQGSVLSPLLFIIVLEALSRDFRVGVPWELFFADDLVIIATSLEECVERVKAWKEGLESKGLHVNMTKTKFMASGLGLDILQDSGKFPCAVCRTGVGRSSIRCSKCNLWVHYKKCSGLKTFSEDLSYECPRCRGVPGVRPVDGRPFKEVEVGDCVLEAVDRFCYLGDMLSAGGGCMAAATARCRCAWGKFRENLPLLTSKPVPFDLRGRLFSSNVRSSMLHGTETWPMTSAALHRLCRNDRAMIRWICGVKPSDDPSMDELHAKLGICDLAILVRERRLRWFGHVMRSNGEINRVRSRPVPGRKGPGRPKKTWEECVKQDLKVCGLSEAGTQDRLSWRSSVKNSRQEPTPSNGSLPQSMAEPPARRVLGMRTRSFNKTGFDWLIDWLYDESVIFSPILSLDSYTKTFLYRCFWDPMQECRVQSGWIPYPSVYILSFSDSFSANAAGIVAFTLWDHSMETLSLLLEISVLTSLVDSPHQVPVIWSFDDFLLLSKQSRGRSMRLDAHRNYSCNIYPHAIASMWFEWF